MKISFTMPAYNKELYLNDAITSVLYQDYKNIELVIVDDKSTDGTKDVCMHYVREFPGKVKYIRNSENLGVGRTRNIAWDNATGDVICVNDADDLSLIHRARLTAEAFRNNDIDILYGGCMAVNHRNENVGYRIAEDFHVSKLKRENFIQHPTVAYRRDIPVKYRDVRFIDDWYFYLDCVDKGLKFGMVKDIIGVYRLIHDGLTQDGGFYHEKKEKAKAELIDEFKDFQEDISDVLKEDIGQQTRIKAILKEIPKDSKVLDIGCNGGYIMQLLKKKGCKVAGIEISGYLVRKCKGKGLNVQQCDVLCLDRFPMTKYDIILLGDILEHYHIEDVSKILLHVYLRLKKGGKAVITVPYKYGRHSTRMNPDHVRDYDIEDFKMIMSDFHNLESKAILVGDNAVPDWILIRGEK